MKIIAVSNFNNEMYSDWLVAENVNEHMGKRIVDALNAQANDCTTDFFKCVPDDHKLYKFEP